jgi:hypothetical protein
MTMSNRTAPDVSPEVAFTELELWLLDELVQNKGSTSAVQIPTKGPEMLLECHRAGRGGRGTRIPHRCDQEHASARRMWIAVEVEDST